ncbi:hypothetical protein COCSADRAFT_267217 [Bipolaris sorokiniana ND90Pr]|uniref:MARVEL domain-containing protein n=1 Tax=Cochliobolus sativus (strain ND90Pr / ATCC 201652) TaxID=665912 RepID=M2SLB5_COCSN|nr:uncharacterized protein COCSADRAFT_267217 [Bipolaris sorokiniana ND90Pr]EMD67968.1 hypothetical protein COCSADRAFT_267217 [Bipolaris sorokiniana ND90Pr]
MEQGKGLWKKRILVPFWIVRICLMIFIIAIFAYTLRTLKDLKDFTEPGPGTVVLFILFMVIVLLIDVLAILLFLRDKLKPGTFLTMNCFQTGFWAGVLIVDFVAIGHGVSPVGIGFSIFVFLTFLGLLIYSIIGHRRAKAAAQRGHYAPAHNPALPATDLHGTPYFGAPDNHQNTAYHSQTHPPPDAHDQYAAPPSYQAGAAGDYYQQQPMKPAHIV